VPQTRRTPRKSRPGRAPWYNLLLDALEEAYRLATSRDFERAEVSAPQADALVAQAEGLLYSLRALTSRPRRRRNMEGESTP